MTNRILEVDNGKIYGYEAGYSGFLELKAQREEMELASERKRKSVLRMELEWAKRGCRARSTKQRARLERLEALKNGKVPEAEKSVDVAKISTRMGKKTIELHHISKGYGERNLIRDLDYIVLRDQRLGIIGPNGCGKSTLLKMMAGQIAPDEGEIEIGETIRIGYFAQEVPDMDNSVRVIDYIKDFRRICPDGRRENQCIGNAGAIPFHAGDAVHAGGKTVRRRKTPPLSSECSDAGSECPSA